MGYVEREYSKINKDNVKETSISYLRKLSPNKYKYILASSHTYASTSSIGIRVSLKKWIYVLNILSSRLRIYTKLKEAYQSEFHLDKHFLYNKKIFNSKGML